MVVEEVVEKVGEEQPAAELSLEEQLAAANAQAAEYLDGWQRARAEFANARKRLEKQGLEMQKEATINVARKLLPPIDDLERALLTVPPAVAEDPWFKGLELVGRKLKGLLDSIHVERIPAVGQPFDPTFHEALSSEESDEHASGIIIKELQPGYKLGDRVIRPSLVQVAR
ncbi:MAG: nucleotide exchange factor GrpE [Chloroflexota bacterium]